VDEAIAAAWVDVVLGEPRPGWRSDAFGPAVVELWPQLPELVPPDSAQYTLLSAEQQVRTRALLDSGLDPLVVAALTQGRVSSPGPGKIRRGDLLVFAYHSEEHGEDWPPGTGVALVVGVSAGAVVAAVVVKRYQMPRRRLPLGYLASPSTYDGEIGALPLIVGGRIPSSSVYFRVLQFHHDIEVAVQFPQRTVEGDGR